MVCPDDSMRRDRSRRKAADYGERLYPRDGKQSQQETWLRMEGASLEYEETISQRWESCCRFIVEDIRFDIIVAERGGLDAKQEERRNFVSRLHFLSTKNYFCTK